MFVAAMAATGCTGDAEPPITDAAPPGAVDAAPVPGDAAPDASPIDAGPPVVCDAPAYEGPLCGPPERPCLMLADTAMPSRAVSRNDAPAVAVDDRCLPLVAYSESFDGFHARLGADGRWVVTETPFPIATVAAAVTPEGSSMLLAYGGTGGLSLWTLWDVAGDWSQLVVPGSLLVEADGMKRDSNGVLHAVLRDEHVRLHYASLATDPAGTWQIAPLGEDATIGSALALSPDDVPHMARWQQDDETGVYLMSWSQREGAIETVGRLLPSAYLDNHALAVGPADTANPGGRPHVLFMGSHEQAPGGIGLLYATRTGADTWTNVLVDDFSWPGASYCDVELTPWGGTCEKRNVEIVPVGVVVGPTGDVRLLYIKNYIHYTLPSSCQVAPRGEDCEWTVSEDFSRAELYVAWPDETGAIVRATVAETSLARTGTVALDRMGNVHMALYGDAVGGLVVRYLRIGPGGP